MHVSLYIAVAEDYEFDIEEYLEGLPHCPIPKPLDAHKIMAPTYALFSK